jgi:hypothetical protein
MKRFLLAVMMFVPFNLMAAIPEFNTMADKYGDTESVIVTTIDRDMIQLFASQMEGIEMIDNIVVILSEDQAVGKAIIDEAKSIVLKIKADELLDANNEGTDVEVYTLKEGDMISDIIVIIGDDSQMGVSVISGNISLEDIGKLIQVV